MKNLQIYKLAILLIVLIMSTSLLAQMTLQFNTTLSAGTTVTLPLYETVNVTVDWGDSGPTNAYTTTGNKDHTYTAEGTYTVSISGTLTQFGNGTGTYDNADKLVKVTSFGSISLTSLYGAFRSTTNLEEVPSTLPATITNLRRAFVLTGKASITGLDDWDVSNVTDMYEMFSLASAFNQDISAWNVANVTDMNHMFYHATAFNQNIGIWNVSNVTDMDNMFNGAVAFNQNIGSWIVEKVTDMNYMFYGATVFNQNIGSWDVSEVTNMRNMFYNATAFNQNIGSWNVSKVTNMSAMFYNADAFNQDIGDWDVGEVTSMFHMFRETFAFNGDISSWDVSKVTGMSYMFLNAIAFNQDIGSWDVSKVENITSMLSGVTLSTANYDALLIGWAALDLYDGLSFNGGSSKYSSGTAATARQSIIDDDSWSISDGGLATDITWDGSSSTDWNTEANWDSNTVPTSNDNVIVPNVAKAPLPVIADDGTASCANLTINNGASLTIQSSATGTGSLIVEGTATGNVTVERYLTEGNWHYISAPVNDTRIFDVFLGLTGGANNDQFYWWDEDGTYEGDTGIWFDILNNPTGISYSSNSFLQSQGYAITYAGSGSETINFSGVPYTENKTITITKTDASTNTGANLVGNPFCSTIAITEDAQDENNFIEQNSSVLRDNAQAVYFWDESQNDYATKSNGSGAIYAAPGQGFMVIGKNASELLEFNVSTRKHGTATFYKSSSNDDVSRIEILVNDSENRSNSTSIAFLPEMTFGLDPSYDASKLKGNPDIALYTKLIEDNGVDFAIQALPPLNNEKLEVKIGLDVSNTGSYHLKINELQNFDETTSIKLEDKENGSLIDLRQIEEYSFNINQSGQIRERFVLHFNNATGIEDHEQESENIRFYVYNHKLYIIDKELKNGTIQLFNMLGQPVMEQQYSQAVNTLDLNLKTGYYVVRIITDKHAISGKIYVE